MGITRRRWLASAAAALAGQGALARRASAQAAADFPSKPIRIIVPYGAGSTTDIATRLIGPLMSERLGQPVVIENRAGATGILGSEYVAKSPPDGYTLVMGTVASHATLVPLVPTLSYNVLRDFTPLGLAVSPPALVACHPSVPAKSLAEFVAWSRTQGDGVSYSSSGTGGSGHLSTELLRLRTGAKLVHVPYKEAGRAVSDLVAGHVKMMIYYAPLLPHIRSGRLTGLAVLADKRVAFAPELPTAVEQGLPLVSSGWNGLFGPAGLAPAVRDKIATALRDAVTDARIQTQLQAGGQEATPLMPADFTRFVQAEIAKWTEVVQQAGVRME